MSSWYIFIKISKYIKFTVILILFIILSEFTPQLCVLLGGAGGEVLRSPSSLPTSVIVVERSRTGKTEPWELIKLEIRIMITSVSQ